MSDRGFDYPGGDIVLDGRPHGQPFLKPLYGPPPYQYTNDTVLIVVYEAPEAAIREVLPRELEPLPGNSVALCFFLCPDVTGIGPHNFTMPCIPVRYGDYVAQYVPYLYTSTDASLACYREGQGWPAVFGQTELVQSNDKVSARVTRNGQEVIRATAEVGGELITTLDFLPLILYREFASVDGKEAEAAYLLTSTSLFTDLKFHGGRATLDFPNHGDDPIARLSPLKITAAVYGTMDDRYPETIRVLKRLK
ncbi:MAG: acetoacetate decarboxylase family protein [Gammaproteobacteria bacterium]|nr:acetoacetate decarboxylase family protein [Gammaproteobacteria bacterium]